MVEAAGGLVSAPAGGSVEITIENLVQWLRLFIETAGAIVIAGGVFVTLYQFGREFYSPELEGYNKIRLTLARYLGVALEFQLGADILSTAIAPGWDQIGKLAAIAIIRTVLNFFLSREISGEREKAETVDPGGPRKAADGLRPDDHG